MRTLRITIQTDSDQSLEELKFDLSQEIYCCSAWFDVDNFIVEELSEEEENHGTR